MIKLYICRTVNIMGVCFVGREHVGKPRCRWEDAVSRDIAGLRQIRNCRTAEINRERCTKKIGNAMAQKWAAARYKKKKEKINVISSYVIHTVYFFIILVLSDKCTVLFSIIQYIYYIQ